MSKISEVLILSAFIFVSYPILCFFHAFAHGRKTSDGGTVVFPSNEVDLDLDLTGNLATELCALFVFFARYK